MNAKKMSSTEVLEDFVKKSRSDHLRFIAKADEIFMGIFRKLEEHETFLKKITKTNQNIDEYVCLVLRTLRQIEGIQPCYSQKEKEE